MSAEYTISLHTISMYNFPIFVTIETCSISNITTAMLKICLSTLLSARGRLTKRRQAFYLLKYIYIRVRVVCLPVRFTSIFYFQTQELKPDGRNIMVTAANRMEYIHLVSDYMLNKQVHELFFNNLNHFEFF